MEVLGDDMMSKRMDKDFLLVAGVGVTMNERPVRRRCTQNGMHRHANINFGARRNDPAARFQHVTRVFLLDALTNSVAQSFSAPAVAPPRILIDLAIEGRAVGMAKSSRKLKWWRIQCLSTASPSMNSNFLMASLNKAS